MRLFVFDIDGTILPMGERNLAEKTIAALNDLLSRGDAVCFASGRPFSGIKQYLDCLRDGKKYIIASNGAALYDEQGRLLYESFMHIRDFYYLHARYAGVKTSVYAYDNQNNLAIFGHDKWVQFELDVNKISHIVDCSGSAMIDPATKIYKVMLAGDATENQKIVLDSADRKAFNVMRSAPTFLEILSRESEKAICVARLQEHLDLQKENVFTFGDGGNDVRMLKEFNGVAMGNATPECKKVSKFVTKNVKEDGVVFAIEYFKL